MSIEQKLWKVERENLKLDRRNLKLERENIGLQRELDRKAVENHDLESKLANGEFRIAPARLAGLQRMWKASLDAM